MFEPASEEETDVEEHPAAQRLDMNVLSGKFYHFVFPVTISHMLAEYSNFTLATQVA